MILQGISREKMINFIDRCAVFFFMVLAFFLPISTAAVESSFGFILFFFIVRIILKRPTREEIKKFFGNRINFCLLIFYIAIAFSMFISGPLWAKSLRAWITKWGEGIALFYFAQVFLNKKQIKIILLVMIASAFLLSIDGIYQRVAGLDLIRGRSLVTTTHGNLAVSAAFQHYNDFAAFLGVMIFIAIGFLVYVKRFWQKLLLSVVFLLISANIILTFSRGAWVSLLIVCLFLAMFIKNKKSKLLFLLFLVSFVGVILSFPSLKERFFLIVKDGGDADRFKVWRVALTMFSESPLFGKGLGLFMSHFSKYTHLSIQYAHNCYLQILAETGLLGFVFFIWFLGEIVSRGYKKLRKKPDSLLFGLFFGLVVFLIHSFFDTQLFSVRLSLLFWIIASFVTIYLSQTNCQKEL